MACSVRFWCRMRDVGRHSFKHVQSNASYSCVRTLLSSAYSCENAWEERLKSDILKKVAVDELAMRMQIEMDSGKSSPLDIDILANKLHDLDPKQLDFAENLFHRFRQTSLTLQTLDSTSHSIVRELLQIRETSRLLHMLRHKKRYGVFIDHFSANLCMDYFIENGDYLSAAEIAGELMLSEDFGSGLTQLLAMYSCHLAWRHLPREVLTKHPPDPAEPDEEQLVRVAFIVNPWYDDHFDLATPALRIGKTLAMLTAGQEGTLSVSEHVAGLALWDKLQEAVGRLEALADSRTADGITADAVRCVETCLADYEACEPVEVEPSLRRLRDVIARFTPDVKAALQARCQAAVARLSEQGLIVEHDVSDELRERVVAAAGECTEAHVATQIRTYRQWADERVAMLTRLADAHDRNALRHRVAACLKELTEQEERLAYFHQQNEVSLKIAKRPIIKPFIEEKEDDVYVAAPHERTKTAL